MEHNIHSFGAAIFFFCFAAVCQGQLSLEALPDVLFVNNSGVHNVELGTVIRARCTASSSSAPIVVWFKDGDSLLNDPPHIRIRTSTDDTEVTSVLTIDNFNTGDDGDYYCQAYDSTTTLNSTTLSLTVIDDNTISLLRDPVTREIEGGGSGAVKTYDSIRDNRTSYGLGGDFDSSLYQASCCQVLRCIINIPGDQTAAADIDLLSVAWLKNEEEIVHMTGRTEITNILRYQPPDTDATRYISRLVLMSFQTSDVGIYQCVYSDYDSDRELVFSTPFRLDADSAAVGLVAVSPVDIILDPPGKLVIEVESSGGYYRHAWYKNDQEIFPNGDNNFRVDSPERFSEFFQVFVQDPTTTSDHGIYRVDLIEEGTSVLDTEVLDTQEFTVTPPVPLSVDALNSTNVTVVEGEDVDISCLASANPLPSDIVWTFAGDSTSFSQTDTTENKTANITSAGTFSFSEGNITSTLHITAAEYPTNVGVYTCTSTTDTTTLNASITVIVQVPPEVFVSATSSRIAVGQSTNITCSITRSVPSNYTIEWTLTSTSDVTTTLNETGETLMLTDIAENEFGTYTCTATNAADLSGSANTTIEEGALPEVSIEGTEAALLGDNVTLNCTATGDTPLTYQWTVQGSTDILNEDSSSGILTSVQGSTDILNEGGSSGVLTLTNITMTDFETYTCEVFNILGSSASDIVLEQGTSPTTSVGQSISIVEGDTLKLMVTIESNLVLDSIDWTQNDEMLMSGTDRVTIDNSDLDPPNTTSTLIRTSIDRSSDNGSYVLTATNRAGFITTEFIVDVFYPPETSVSATKTRLLVNDSTILKCSVTVGNPSDFTVMWTLTNTSGDTITLNETEPTLEVSRIGEDEFGTYTCNVTNSAGLSGAAEIAIEQGAIPEVSTDEVDIAIPGDNVTLNCTATGDTPLTYQWTMQGSANILNNDPNTGILELMNINESQFGIYICNVSNALGTGISNVTIEQATAPVAGDDEIATFAVGDDLVLTASFSDFNLALDEITWTQNTSMTLMDGVGGVIITSRDLSGPSASSTLTRPGITGVSYAGTYTATASNRAGTNSTVFTVEVTAPPVLQTSPVQYVFDEGSEGTLLCTATGIPAVTIYWQFEGVNITSDMMTNTFMISINDLIMTTGRLTITFVERSNVGTYTCVGTNGRGANVSVDSTVTVNYPPSIITAPDGVEAVYEEMVELSCTAEGLPMPTIMWQVEPYGGGLAVDIMIPTSITQEGNTTHTSVLTLLRVSPNDTANYTCTASNRLGSETESAYVEVLAGAEILPGMPVTVTVNDTDSVDLLCSARGSPVPSFTWFVGEEEASLNMVSTSDPSGDAPDFIYINSTLNITSVTPDDSNIYTCVASNSLYGEQVNDSHQYTLIVNFAPVVEEDPTDVSVVAPDPVTLMCTARGEPLPVIVWIKEANGTRTEYSVSENGLEISTVQSASTTTSTFTIDSTDLVDTGNYSCVAGNLLGNATSQPAGVTVFITPSVVAAQRLYLAIEFQIQKLTCSATGVPAPTISFARDDVILDRMGNISTTGNLSERVNLRQQTENSDGLYMVTRTLEIVYPVGQDTGNYTCTASIEVLNQTLSDSVTFDVVVQTAPVISVPPVDAVVVFQDTAVFYCEAYGVLTPDITWRVNGVILDSGSRNVIIMNDTRDTTRSSTLQVLNTLPNDTATYTCVATNAAGNTTASADLTVNLSPFITAPTPGTVITVNEGMAATFECTAIGIPGPNITWRRERDSSEFNDTLDSRVTLGNQTAPIPNSILIGTIFSVSRQLTLSNTTDSDSGIYVCQASNGVEDNLEEAFFELFIAVAPVVRVSPEERIDLQGDSAVFICNATARPRPIITWWRANSSGGIINQVLNDMNKNIIESEPYGEERGQLSTLTILVVQPSDAGMYLCQAENQAGTAEASASLTVHVIPNILFPPVDYQYITNQFMEVILECNATGIPPPSIQFFLGNTPLDSQFSDRFSLMDPVTKTINISGSGDLVSLVTRQLSISPALDADSNNYSCVATNENQQQPSVLVEFELIVRVAPNVTDGPDSQTVLANDSVTFSCVAEGRPPPSVTWLQQSTDQTLAEVEEGEGVSIVTIQRGARETVSNLTFQSAQPRDAVEYTCIATNVAGNDTRSATLTVHVLPSILLLEPSPLLTVNESASATFQCTATGIPAPVISWFMGTEELITAGSGDVLESLTSRIDIQDLDESLYLTAGGNVSSVQSNLTISSTVGNDSGQYSCNASNMVGISMRQADDGESTTLFVQVPPLVVPVISDVIGNENMNATLQFRIDNADPTVLLSGLRWFYSEQLVDSISHGRVVEITNRTNRTSESELVTSFSSDGVYFNITVVNIAQERLGGEETDRGRYFLQATNPAGSSVAFIDLEVYGPPLIISPPVDGFVLTGDMSVFQCTALAFPSHYVEWTFVNSDGESTGIVNTTAGNTTKYRIDNKKSSPTFGQIVIVDVQYSDRGEYVCRAINEVGTVNATATLTVHVPPIIEAASPEMRINISEPAFLACLITGYPRPNITWKKNDEVFSTNTARINIFEFEVRAVDSGSGSDISYMSSGFTGSGSIADLLREADFTEEDIQGLGELGVVAIVAFESLERSDTGDYMCSAENSLPGLQTGIQMAIPAILPLTVLEVPDVPTNFTNGSYGSRWVSLEWTFGFDGNSAVLSFRVRIRQSSEEPRVLPIQVTRQDMNSYNVTENILPFISYEFQVSICNAIGCGGFTDIVTVMTEEDAPDAAPAITESVSPTSTSLRISWSAPAAEKRNGILIDYVVCYSTDPELPMDTWQKTSAPITNIILTGLSIFTEYNVSVAAATEAGVGPFDSVTVQTLNDTCSEPLGVMFTDVGETTVSLEWSESAVPNGIVESYSISYAIEGTDNGIVNTVISETESIQLVNLEPFTQYIVTVTCVNAAGPGNTSSPAEIRTDSAPPIIPDNTIEVSVEQPDRRQFIVVFNKPDESNGPISHYHAVAVKVPLDATLRDPNTDFESFQSINNVYSPICDDVIQTTAYIAAEFSRDEFQGNTLQFIFGDEEDTLNLNDNPRYSNGPLCYSTNYAFFLRVYNDVSANVQRSVRQVSGRQYDRFSSSDYVTYTTASEPSDNTATVAAVVIVLVVVIVAVVSVVLVAWLIIKKRRVLVFKTTATEAVDFDTSYYQQNEQVQLTEFRSPEEGVAHEPIPVGQLASYVEQLHMNENCGFGEEYKAIQDLSPRHSVEVCVHPDNKQRNRYANIQCFDHSRCTLKALEQEDYEHDYINANFIDGYNHRNEYIATQGPLPNTVADFWRLVWDRNAYSIIMLTNLIEKMKVKCSQYWPNSDSQTYADITVTFKSSVTYADFAVRAFEVKRGDSEEVRQVHQFHYLSWPDFGVPRHATPLLHFLHRVRDVHRYSNAQPMLIHCSAGVGRTGTLITIDVEMQRAQKQGVVDPYNYVLKMRGQRNQMVQTEAQYIFLYDAILEGTTSGGTEIPVDALFGRMKELDQLDRDGETGYQAEFKRLRQFRVNVREFTDANDDANKFKNRLANALPYNYNRVYLATLAGVDGSNYINASYIDGYTRKGAFIATQGPLENTIDDFWRMVSERDVHVIVMLTQLEERGKELCARYWPTEVSAPETRGPVSIELLSEDPFDDYVHRKIKLNETVKGTTSSRVVHHFQFMAWPENGAPKMGEGMIDLIDQVLRVQQQSGNKAIVVHCSAGIGRTGAFCALSTAIERVKAEGLIDVFHTVKHLRTQRPHMVQTVEQYMFCYRAISEYVASLDQYSNFV